MGFLTERYCFKQQKKRFAAFGFDLLGSLFYFPFKLKARPIEPDQIRGILIIRLDQIGDVIMTRPAVAEIQRRFPQADVDLLVSEEIKPLFEKEQGIREVIGMNCSWFGKKNKLSRQVQEGKRIAAVLRRNKYDLAVDFRGDVRNILLMFFADVPWRLGYGRTGGGFLLSQKTAYPLNKHQVDINLRLLECLGISGSAEMPRFSYSEDGKQDFHTRFPELAVPHSLPRIVVHPAAGYPSKKWPEKKFKELIEMILTKENAQVIVIGTEEDKRNFSDIQPQKGKLLDLRGKTRLEDLPVLFDACDFYIGNDSGPAHLAAAQGMEVISIFSGANAAGEWHPWTKRLSLVTHAVPCSPCESPECPLLHHDCMEKISVGQVFEAFKKRLEFKKSAEKAK